MTDNGKTFYFGRGSSNCIAVKLLPGDYAEIFVGNGKTQEAESSVIISRCQFSQLSEFFMKLGSEYGHGILPPAIDLSVFEN